MTDRKRDTSSFKTKRSDVTRMDKNSETPDEFDRPLLCHIHAEKYLKLYCAFCEKPICERCKSTEHARHPSEIKGHSALIRAAKNRRQTIKKMLYVREKLVVPRIKGLIVEISESKAKLQNRVENVIKRYQNYVTLHRDKLIVPDDIWIGELHFSASKYQQTMDEKVLFLKEQLVDVESTLELVKKELNSASHAELLLLCNTLRFGLEFLHEPKWPREEIFVSLELVTVPHFGSIMFQTEKSADKKCRVTFEHEIVEPVVFSRIYDTHLPIPKKVFEDENAKISLTSATEMYVSFGEYIISYTLDNRRYKKASSNMHFTSIMTVRENIIDISCDQHGNLFYVTRKSVSAVTEQKKILKCFPLVDTPSALCITRDGQQDIFLAYHDVGKIMKYDRHGEVLMDLTHPDPRMVYRPRHMTMNYIGDVFFSDDISNVTILDENGIWKGAISRDVKTSSACGPLRPTGIACSLQRHVFIIDNNAITNIHIFSEDGKYLQTAVFKNLKDAYVLNIDRTGDLWIAFKDGRIRIYRPDFMQDLDR